MTETKAGKDRSSMVKPIMKDVFFLGQKSEPATKEDLQSGRDLQDTLRAHKDRCVGMAANMIGIRKNIIVVDMGMFDVVMFNPVILKMDTPYEAEEGCLSLKGRRKVLRHLHIELLFSDENGREKIESFSRLEAEAIQHEMDHMEGFII